jgi:hypothetical protein
MNKIRSRENHESSRIDTNLHESEIRFFAPRLPRSQERQDGNSNLIFLAPLVFLDEASPIPFVKIRVNSCRFVASPIFPLRSLLPASTSPARLDLSPMTLGLHPPALCCARGLGLSAKFGFVDRRSHHRTQSLHHRLAVLLLCTVRIRGNMNLLGGGQAFAGDVAQALGGARSQSPERRQRRPHLGFGVYLIDVLPARAAAAGVLESKSRLRDLDARRKIEPVRRGRRRREGRTVGRGS